MNKSRSIISLAALVVAVVLVNPAPWAATPRLHAEDAPGATGTLFKSKILPVLSKHCYECHSTKTKKAEGGLTLDTQEGRRRGGDRGPAVVPKDVDESILIDAIKYAEEDLQMPPNGKLPNQVIEDFVKWIEEGA